MDGMAPRKPTRTWGQASDGGAISTVVVVNPYETLLSYFPNYQSFLCPCQDIRSYGCLRVDWCAISIGQESLLKGQSGWGKRMIGRF
jgi:hypothetical protein